MFLGNEGRDPGGYQVTGHDQRTGTCHDQRDPGLHDARASQSRAHPGNVTTGSWVEQIWGEAELKGEIESRSLLQSEICLLY